MLALTLALASTVRSALPLPAQPLFARRLISRFYRSPPISAALYISTSVSANSPLPLGAAAAAAAVRRHSWLALFLSRLTHAGSANAAMTAAATAAAALVAVAIIVAVLQRGHEAGLAGQAGSKCNRGREAAALWGARTTSSGEMTTTLWPSPPGVGLACCRCFLLLRRHSRR